MLQQLTGAQQASLQHVAVRRLAEACAEHAHEVIFRECRQLRQFTQAERLIEMLLDVFCQPPAQVRRQAALDLQTLAQADLGQQHMVDHLVGQAAAKQALAGLGPVQLHQLAKLPGQLRIIEEGAFAQLQLARFAVEQGDRAGGETLGAHVKVGQADFAIDHPG